MEMTNFWLLKVLLTLSGRITLPAGISVVVPIHELNNDPQYWEHPKKMMPDRFLPENVKQRDPNVFVPFSLGPMNCLGKEVLII